MEQHYSKYKIQVALDEDSPDWYTVTGYEDIQFARIAFDAINSYIGELERDRIARLIESDTQTVIAGERE